jgi:hypothetical protein
MASLPKSDSNVEMEGCAGGGSDKGKERKLTKAEREIMQWMEEKQHNT